MEALPHGKEVPSEDRQYEFEIFIRSTGSECKASQWLDFLSDYHFEIKHIKGKENNVIDSLSQ